MTPASSATQITLPRPRSRSPSQTPIRAAASARCCWVRSRSRRASMTSSSFTPYCWPTTEPPVRWEINSRPVGTRRARGCHHHNGDPRPRGLAHRAPGISADQPCGAPTHPRIRLRQRARSGYLRLIPVNTADRSWRRKTLRMGLRSLPLGQASLKDQKGRFHSNPKPKEGS